MMRKLSAVLSILIFVCLVTPVQNHVFGGIFEPKPVFAQSRLVLEDFALYSQKEIKLDNIGESRGNVGSNGIIDIKKGASGSVIGFLQALGELKNEAEIGIYGDVTARIIEDKGSLSVSGQKIEGADLVPLALPGLSVSASGPDLAVPEKSSMTVVPGSYGRLRLKKGAAVYLSSGEYFFVKFELDESASVNLDTGGGAVHINVVDKLKFKKDSGLQIVAGHPADIHLNFQGTDKIEVGDHAVVRGILTAPWAKVDFKKGSRLEGAAYAGSIHLAKGASFRHYAVSSDGRPPTADAGGHQTALAGEQVELDGSGSSDPDGDAITFHWSFVSFPDGSSPAFSDPTDPKPTFTPDLTGAYQIELAVDDGIYTSLRDTATVTVVTEVLDITDFVLYADDNIKMDEIIGGTGHVGANRHLHIEKGTSGTITGDLHLLGHIKNNGEILLDGDVYVNSKVDEHDSLNVTGTINTSAQLKPRKLPSLSFSAEGPDLHVPASAVETLAPGSYGRVEVNKGATLRLTAGSYFLGELKTDDSAILTLNVSDGAIELNVVKKLELGKDADLQIIGGGTRDVRFNYAGKKEVEIEDRGVFRGTLIAPQAMVEFEKDSRLEGAVYAKRIYLDKDKGVSFSYHENRPPLAVSRTVSTMEDTPASFTLGGSDPDGDSLTFAVSSPPLHGRLDGTAPDLIYTPDENYNGADSFTFKVDDGQLDSQSATVSITINAVNDAPVAAADHVSTNEDTTLIAASVLGNDTDVDGDSLLVDGFGPAIHGTVTDNGDGTFSYTPNEDFHGTDTFTYSISDGQGGTAQTNITVTVNPVNDAPVAVDDMVTTEEDAAMTVAVLANDTDVDGDPLVIVNASQGANGTVSINPDGTITYSPNSDFNGSDSFVYSVDDGSDGSADSLPATVSIIVAAVNDAPVADAQSIGLNEDESVSVLLTASDVEGDALEYTIVGQPSHGTLSGTAPSLTYTPGENYNGSDEFSFTANDGSVDSLPATVSISVAPVNDAPVASAGSDQSVIRTDTVTLDGSGSGDADHDLLSYSWSFLSVPEASQAVLIDPGSSEPSFVADLAGEFEIELVVNDGNLDSTPHRVIISVAPMMVAVPDVTGLLQTEAGSAIIAAGLAPGPITTEHSDTVPTDHVISQNPPAIGSIEENSAVSMVVSLGPEFLPPTVSLTASCSEIYQGQPCMLTWSTTDALSAHIDNGIGTVAVIDSLEVYPGHTTTYTITATGPGGSAADSVQVKVIVVPEDVDYGLGYNEQQGGGGLVGETIRILNGNQVEVRNDINIASPNSLGLTFEAFYNSRSTHLGELGFGWTHTYSVYLETGVDGLAGDFIRLVDETGRARYFLNNGAGLFEGHFNEHTHVRAESGEYVWDRSDGSRYGFSAQGKVVWIEDEKGNELSLVYNSQGHVETVAVLASARELTFNYTDGLLDHIAGPITVALSDGIRVSFTYDADSNLVSVTYADGSGFEYTYADGNDAHNLTEKRIKSNHLLTSWGYDDQDRCIANYSVQGNGATIDYADAARVDVTDAYGTLRTYTIGNISGRKRVTAMQGLAGAPYEGGNLVGWQYDAAMNLVRVQTAGGIVHRYQDYNARGNPTTVISAAGSPEERTVTFSYHPEMNTVLTRSEPGVLGAGNKVTIFDYDDDYDAAANENPTNLVSRIIEQGFTRNAAGATVAYEYITTFTYNAKGQLSAIDGPLSGSQDTTHFAYDGAGGNLLAITHPLIGDTTFANYDAAGQPGRMTDVNNRSQSLSYDGRGRVTAIAHEADGSLRTVSYNTIGLPDTATDEDGVAKTFDYNDNSRLSRIYDVDDNYIEHLYDAQSNLIERGRYDAMAARTGLKRWYYQAHTDFDGRQPDIPGKLWKARAGVRNATTYGYNADGLVSSVTDPNGYTTYYDYDAQNRLITVTQPAGSITSYDYDGHGNLVSVVDGESRITSFTYDDMGRVVATTSPESGTAGYVYDAAGNRVQKTDAMGTAVVYTYDVLNRLTGIQFPDTNQDIGFSYDEGADGAGRRTGMTDPAGTTVFEYDHRGRLVDKTATVDGIEYRISRTYTPGNRLNSLTYPSGRSINLSRYDTNQKIQAATTTYNSLTQTLVDNLSYNPFGGPKGLETGSGGAVSNKSGDCNCLEGINPGTMMEQNYSYDDNGNLFAISAPNTPWLDQRLDYDAQNRLVSATGAYGTIGYTYDMVGNRLSRTGNGQTDTYTYKPGTNRLAEINGTNPATFSYDDNGNIMAIDGRTFVYNQNNRLIRVEQGVDILGEYRYNGLGQRIIKEVAGTATVYHYDFDGNIIAESTADGTFNVEYLYMGGSRLARVEVGTSALTQYLNNYLGTPILMTDDTGTVVWEAVYKPFGEASVNPNSSVVNNFRFSGQYFDEETDLHYNYHRYYDPKTGRYLTPDPIGLAGGINLYQYASANPINAVDPWGLRPGSAVRPGVRGLDPSAHPVFQPGTPEHDYIVKDVQDYIQWNLMLPWKILIWMAGDDEGDTCPPSSESTPGMPDSSGMPDPDDRDPEKDKKLTRGDIKK